MMKMQHTEAVYETGRVAGLHLGVQLFVQRGEEVLVDGAWGMGGRDRGLGVDSVLPWASCSKSVVAGAFLLLWQRGRVGLEDRVSKYLPAFGCHGKENITVRHLLTHTAGLRLVDAGWPETTWPEIIARLCGARLEPNWVPGEKAGYHAFSTWYLLGELIRVIDGRDVAEFVRAEVFAPLGMRDCYLALPAEAQAELGKRLVVMHNSFKGPPEPMATEVPAVLAQCRPGGSGRGPMRELAKFYRALVLEGAGIWTPPVVAALTARHRVGLYDHSFKKPMDWGLGVMLNSNYLNEGEHPYGFGPGVSLRTFGHGGYQSAGSFADPVTGLVVCYAFVGMPGERRHEARRVAFLRALREDVGGV